jgi:4-hydroxy-2-oxoheptanedioate aldolase
MMGSVEQLRDKWAADDGAVGGWLSIANTVTAEVMARAGFDYVCVDNQHGVVGYADIPALIQVIGIGPSVPMVRVPWNEPGVIGKVLDAGAHAVIVPMVNSPEEARAAVAASRYHPDGSRSYGPTAVGARHSDYFAFARDNVTCIPMIETTKALARLDDILSVPGVDVVYVGPGDLSVSLGLPPGNNDDDPRFVEALETVVGACARHGVVAGIHARPELVDRRRDMGFRMITAISDIGALRSGLGAGSDRGGYG